MSDPTGSGPPKIPSEEEDIFAVDEASEPSTSEEQNADLEAMNETRNTNSSVLVKSEGDVQEDFSMKENETNGGETKKGKKRKKKRLDWVTEPNKFLYLDVYSGGKLIKQIPLGAKSRYLIGRDKECGILMMHPSISRKHAAICHGVPPDTPGAESGSATLLDLKGGNGTFYTKRYPCRGSSKQRVTPGTGLVLKESMCFRFGESSRSFIVRGMAGATATKANNPNFMKRTDVRDVQMSRDLGIEDDSTKKKSRKTGGPMYKNPFKQSSYSANSTNLMLPTLQPGAPKLTGETTFSFHNKKKTDLDNIKYQHETLNRKRVLELKKKQQKEEKKE